MPIVDRETADSIFEGIQPDDTFYRGIYGCATLGIGPIVLLWNIWAHEQNYKRTYLPQRVLNRAAALKGPHKKTIAKVLRARQLPGLFWWLIFADFVAIIFMLIVILTAELVRGIWAKVWYSCRIQ